MANVLYTRGKAVIGGANGWLAGTYKVMLVQGSYTPDPNNHHFVSDVTGELSGGGYARQILSGYTISEDDVNGRADYIANNPTFTALSSTQTYRWAIVFRFGTTDADSELVCALDAGSISLVNVISHTLQWDGQSTAGRVYSIL